MTARQLNNFWMALAAIGTFAGGIVGYVFRNPDERPLIQNIYTSTETSAAVAIPTIATSPKAKPQPRVPVRPLQLASRAPTSESRPALSPVRQPTKIKDVRPIYPADAVAVRIQGVVILVIEVGVDGSVTNARVIRSIPLLDAAAEAAVRQWLFTPATRDGIPVPLEMTVTVQFSLT